MVTQSDPWKLHIPSGVAEEGVADPAYAVIFGLAPDPFFWKTIGFAWVPVAVRLILAVRVSV